MSTFSQDKGNGKVEAAKTPEKKPDKNETKKVNDAGDEAGRELVRQTEEAEAQKARDAEAQRDPDKPASEQKPANVQQEEASHATNIAEGADTEGTKAGDLAAAEGNDYLTSSSTEVHDAMGSAAARTQEGPSQKDYFNQDDVKVADATEGPVEILTTDDQDADDVQDRVDAELGNLAASQQEENLGVMRTGDGVPAYARPGTMAAAAQGVQQDASGHFESVAHTRSTKSGTRV